MFLDKLIQLRSRITCLLLPPACILCGYQTHSAQNICQACQQGLPILAQVCPQCAQFLTHPLDYAIRCGHCLKSPPPFAATYALFPYTAPIIQLIIKLKFQGQLSHAQALGDLMALKIKQEWYLNKPLPDVIIPVPLHAKRLRERGFNQALEIARPIIKNLGIACDVNGIERIKHTVAQSGLPALERKQNMAHAFQVHRDYRGVAIAILDDVITTGHTVRELCNTIKKHGAKRIDVWCCARRG